MFVNSNSRVPRLLAAGFATALNFSSASIGAAESAVQVSPGLSGWVQQALADNPELQAAASSVAVAKARLVGAGRPLYNPALELEVERTDVDLATVGISQTLDWYNKQGAREADLDSALAVVEADYRRVQAQLATKLLLALVNKASAQSEVELSQRGFELLERFSRLASQRAKAGDLGEIDLGLAKLAVIEGEMQLARQHVQLSSAQQQLTRLSGASATSPHLPKAPWSDRPERMVVEDAIAQHSIMRKARAQSQRAAAAIQRADAERREDPTLGLRAGKEDNETLIGLQLSIPLTVRNRYTAEVTAAQSESLAATHRLEQTRRELRAAVQASHDRLNALEHVWQLWDTQGRKIQTARVQLLEKLWRLGELSTVDYLVQLKQSLETENSGMALRYELWRAWVDWLGASGQISNWLDLSNVRGMQ